MNGAQMHMATTFLDAGWDFVGETQNGTDEIWWILSETLTNHCQRGRHLDADCVSAATDCRPRHEKEVLQRTRRQGEHDGRYQESSLLPRPEC
jgi:hypothetical protein